MVSSFLQQRQGGAESSSSRAALRGLFVVVVSIRAVGQVSGAPDHAPQVSGQDIERRQRERYLLGCDLDGVLAGHRAGSARTQ
jgi:hypothetical protein